MCVVQQESSIFYKIPSESDRLTFLSLERTPTMAPIQSNTLQRVNQVLLRNHSRPSLHRTFPLLGLHYSFCILLQLIRHNLVSANVHHPRNEDCEVGIERALMRKIEKPRFALRRRPRQKSFHSFQERTCTPFHRLRGAWFETADLIALDSVRPFSFRQTLRLEHQEPRTI